MAPNSEGGGLTSALKQVYYIHKSIVADLTSKNQVLTEECKKLKSQAKHSTSSTGLCTSCHRLRRLNRSLQKALQARDANNDHTDKDSPSKTVKTRDKSHPRKRLSDDMIGQPSVGDDDGPRQEDSQKKRRPLHQENYVNLSRDEGDPNKSELLLLEKSRELDNTEGPNLTVLAPETEMVWPTSVVDRSNKASRLPGAQTTGDTSLELEGDEELPSQRVLIVPETLNLEDYVAKVRDDKEREELPAGDNDAESASSDEENMEPCSAVQPMAHHHRCQSEQEFDSFAHRGKGIDLQNKIRISDLNSTGGSEQHSTPADKSEEIQLKQKKFGKASNNHSVEQFQIGKAGINERITREAKSTKHSFQVDDESSFPSPALPQRKGNTSSSLFKVPNPSTPRLVLKSKPDTFNSKSTRKEKSKHSLARPERHDDNLRQSLKPVCPSTPGTSEPSILREHNAEQEENLSFHQSGKFPASMDETIAPNLLSRHQLDAQSVSFASPGPQDTLTEHDQDQSCKEMEHYKHGSTSKQLTELTFSSSTHYEHSKINSNKSPGNKKSLKLNKAETGSSLPRPRVTVREMVKERARQRESCQLQTPKSSREKEPGADVFDETSMKSKGDNLDLSDDSDLAAFSDQEEEETIAPSPQATLVYTLTSSRKLSHPVEEIDNDASHPILLDDDEDVVDVYVESDDDEDDEEMSTLKEDSHCTSKGAELGGVGKQEEGILPDPQQEPLEDLEFDFEDSFDRVPREVRQEVPHVEVVRKRSERDKLEGFSCKQCHEYYKNSGLSEEELKKKMKVCSRHKERYRPPATPEHFWTLGFPDTAEMLDRQSKDGMDVSHIQGE
ncbi:DNA endonuclease RBBP8-like [Elysia marginata]|uniref:DNA endonuclease RBBP8-like n=1 Tax=Elysia marginata TaxID=1093978 RepID=A0AAV4JR60_9GAST|nr:DNA endonuclease RBBP8-like [Elysia marginata]